MEGGEVWKVTFEFLKSEFDFFIYVDNVIFLDVVYEPISVIPTMEVSFVDLEHFVA